RYGRYRENALSDLQSIGIRHVEIGVPAPEKVEEVARQMAQFGLTASTMLAPCDLNKDAEAFAPYARTAKQMGVSILFISAKAGDMPRQQAFQRLREVAQVAEQSGVTLALAHNPD